VLDEPTPFPPLCNAESEDDPLDAMCERERELAESEQRALADPTVDLDDAELDSGASLFAPQLVGRGR
jgi:hypothetical protein